MVRRVYRPRPHRWDVLVVGAGPAGSTCAELLARAGHRVLLLEREDRPGAGANCTGIIGEEAFRSFHLPRELIVNTVSEIRFRGPYRRQVEFAAHRPLAHVVRRHALDAALVERAREAGAELRTGIRVVWGQVQPDGVRLTATGGETELWGRAVVVATGYHLALLRAFGLEGPRGFVQGIQVLCANRGVRKVEVYLGRRYAPGSFGWAVPLEPGWVKVGLTTGRRARRHLESLVTGPELRGRIDLRNARLRLSPVPVGTLPRSYADRILVVGEAAGQVKTTSNGGIYYSMLGARAAAETLDRALRGDRLGAGSLQDYEATWRRTLAAELEAGLTLRAAFEEMSDARLALLMQLASVDGILDVIRGHADFDWHRPLLEALARHGLLRRFLRIRLPTAAPLPVPRARSGDPAVP